VALALAIVGVALLVVAIVLPPYIKRVAEDQLCDEFWWVPQCALLAFSPQFVLNFPSRHHVSSSPM
jgi:hypothetical protein